MEVDDGVAVVSGPGGEPLDGVDEGLAEVGETVLDVPRRLGMTFDQAVVPEPAQRLGEHLARDAADQADQLSVSAGFFAQSVENEHGPLPRDDLDRQTGRTVSQKDISRRVLHEIHGTWR